MTNKTIYLETQGKVVSVKPANLENYPNVTVKATTSGGGVKRGQTIKCYANQLVQKHSVKNKKQVYQGCDLFTLRQAIK